MNVYKYIITQWPNIKPAFPKRSWGGRLRFVEKFMQNYNRCHRTIALPPLTSGDTVWIRDQNKFGAIQERLSSPRSYQIMTETGSSIRRNRQALVHTGTNSNQPVPDQPRCPTPTTQAAFPNGPQSGPSGAHLGPNSAQLGPNRGPHGMLLG